MGGLRHCQTLAACHVQVRILDTLFRLTDCVSTATQLGRKAAQEHFFGINYPETRHHTGREI